MPAVCFSISGHGFGHASRQIEIINTLAARLPSSWTIVVRTAAARWLFERTLRAPVTFAEGPTDTGIVQLDSLRIDEASTVRDAAAFYADFDRRVAIEAEKLRRHDMRLVIADAPPLACAAAAQAGIPSIVLGNFTWDWIYESYAVRFDAEAAHVLPAIRRAYSDAEAGWRLPMHGGFETVTTVVDLPFVARHATRARAEVLEALGIPADKPLALSSFGGYGVSGIDLDALDCRDTWTVVFTGRDSLPPAHGIAHVNEARIYDAGLRYEDLVAAVDVVVTKPGYGIISECVANRTAMLYTSRGRFAEYDVMVREMPAVVRCRYLDQQDLLAGRWRGALDALLDSPPPPVAAATHGAHDAAARILDTLGIGPQT